MKIIISALALLVGMLVSLFVVKAGGARIEPRKTERRRPLSQGLASHPDVAPADPVDLLFIHHSVGGALLADKGPESGDLPACIFESHPSGGGLRKRLLAANYRVHEASYGSIIGEGIDMFDWVPKFRDHMDRVLTTDRQDVRFSDGRRNRVVLFETCYNSNWFKEEGSKSSTPTDRELTVANAKAVFVELRGIFRQHPDTLFVHMTATPLAPRLPSEPLYRTLLRKVLGKPSQQEGLSRSADLSRVFNDWLAGDDGWLSGYEGKNIAVFDNYDLMTGYGRSNALVYPGDANGFDPHPNETGQAMAAAELLPFLNRAVHRSAAAP